MRKKQVKKSPGRPPRMEYLHIKLPRPTIEALDAAAREESRKIGYPVNRSMVVRKLLENSLQNRPSKAIESPPQPKPSAPKKSPAKPAIPKREPPKPGPGVRQARMKKVGNRWVPE